MTVFENIYAQDLFKKKTEKRPYLPTGSELFYESKKRTTSFNLTSTLKISSKFIQSSLRNRPDKKREKKKKKKRYNHYKVFRLKRKTLIIITRNRVKTICSPTSFGNIKIHWKTLKILSRTTGPISKPGSKCLCVKKIWFCSEEGSCLFARAVNKEKSKNTLTNSKNLPEPLAQFQQHSQVKEIHICSNEGSHPFPM